MSITANWVPEGPGPMLNGQVENITPGDEVVGAVHTVAAHPTDANILFAGATNGGIWRTDDATSASPTWTPLTDSLPSLSIGAMEFDPLDSSNQTMLAGVGRFSSLARSGGERTGLLYTTDGGTTWTELNDPILVGENFSGVAARGQTLLASSNDFYGVGGIFRSGDGGASWTSISGTGGLPTGAVNDLVGDPSDPNTFFAAVEGVGVFHSSDGGTTWANITSGDTTAGGINGFITDARNNNTEMAVARNGRLFAAVLLDGQPRYIGFTDDDGGAWTVMDLPQTLELDGDTEGLNPRVKPGGQGAIHFSIVVDPNDPNTVFVGGDRQDYPFPNFIGANNYTGRLFRGNTGVAATGAVPSPQWEHLTHSDSISGIPGGGTASGSAPHADSREMAFDARGEIIEVDDGGIYRRTSPGNNTGDWYSIIGNLQVTEYHAIAYDTISDIIMGGAQDTGTSEQITTGSTTFDSVSTADGGDVAVDTITLAGSNQSIRYSSNQYLGYFTRRVIDANNQEVSRTNPGLVVSGGGFLIPQFYTPIELNAINPSQMVIAGMNSVFESFNQGDTVSDVNGPMFTGGMAYGGYSGGVANSDVLWAAASSGVYLRTTAGGPLTATAYPGGAARDVVIDPTDWRTAYVISADEVYQTRDAGANWFDITGDIQGTDFQTLEFIPGVNTVLVGNRAGVFASMAGNIGSWEDLGDASLPNAPVWDLDYDPVDDMLVAGTLGRGAWSVSTVSDTIRSSHGGPNVIAVIPNEGDLLDDGEVLHIAPRELILRFNEGQEIDPATLGAVQVVRSVNGTFGDGDDQIVDIGYIGVGDNLNYPNVQIDNPNEVFVRFAESLPDDLYQITVNGSDPVIALRNLTGQALHEGTPQEGADWLFHFELDLGAQIRAVVPQPVERGLLEVTAVAGSQINDGDTFTLADGTYTTTFEFESNAVSDGVLSGNVQVRFNPGDTAIEIAQAMASAILGQGMYVNVSRVGGVLTLTPALLPGGGVSQPIFYPNSSPIGAQSLTQKRDTIVVYFNDDELEATAAANASFYQLLVTHDTATPLDDISAGETEAKPVHPIGVSYQANENKAILTFAQDLDQFGTGAFRLRIGSEYQIVRTEILEGATTDLGNSPLTFLDATTLTTVSGAALVDGQTFSIHDGALTTTFEFESLAVSDGVLPGNVPVPYNPPDHPNLGDPGDTAADIARAIAHAINAAGRSDGLYVGASAAAGTVVLSQPNDAGSGFHTAQALGGFGNGTGPQSLIVSAEILAPTSAYNLEWPGAVDEPGHRDLPLHPDILIEDHFLSGGSSPDGTTGIPAVGYHFSDVYGFDATTGGPLLNLITEAQKDRTREIFGLYGNLMGISFVETESGGLHIVTGDLKAFGEVSSPGGIGGIAGMGMAVMDKAEDWGTSETGGGWFQVAMHEIGHLLGYGHSYDLPPLTIMGSGEDASNQPGSSEPVFPGDHDLVHGRHMYRPDSIDIDMYRFELQESGAFSAEVSAERMDTSSLLDGALALYREVTRTETYTVIEGGQQVEKSHPVITQELVARNDDYYSEDPYIDLYLQPGAYFIGVSASGNSAFDPSIDETGIDGVSQGVYDLRLNFTPGGVDPDDPGTFTGDGSSHIVDAQRNILFDGDADGVPGGVYDFWFNVQDENHTIFVDKLSTSSTPDGTLANPFSSINGQFGPTAFNTAQPGDIVRIVGNNFDDDDPTDSATLVNNLPYEIGRNQFGTVLSDGVRMEVPQGVTVMIDEGAVFKLSESNIDVGSSAATVDRSSGALQVLGTPEHLTYFTSYFDKQIGRDSNAGDNTTPKEGNWGGLVFRNKADYDFIEAFDPASGEAARQVLEVQGIFLNYVNHADIRYGGGEVLVNGKRSSYAPVHTIEARPTITYNRITNSSDAAMSSDPNSFADTKFQNWDRENPFTSDYDRVGPEVRNNLVVDNSINGLFIRIQTAPGEPTAELEIPGRFDDWDIVHVLSQNLFLNGTPGGPFRTEATNALTLTDSFHITSTDGSNISDGDTFSLFDGRTKVTFEFDLGEGITPGHLPIFYTPTDSAATVTHAVGRAIRLAFAARGLEIDAPCELLLPAMPADPTPGTGIPDGEWLSIEDESGLKVRFEFDTGDTVIDGASDVSISIDMTAGGDQSADVARKISNAVATSALSGVSVEVLRDRIVIRGARDVEQSVSPTVDFPNVLALELFGPTIQAEGFVKIESREDARLHVDPGMIVKLSGSRIEAEMGSQFIAEGRPGSTEGAPGYKVIFTSLLDPRYGAGGSFDTPENTSGQLPAPGNWGGLYFGMLSEASIDQAIVAYGGGITPIEGGFANFNPIEVRQGHARVTNSRFENNAAGSAGDRGGRGFVAANQGPATIHVRGAQPIIVGNDFLDNEGAIVSIDVNALKSVTVPDWGRTTGRVTSDGDTRPLYTNADNRGPMVRGNRMTRNEINGMIVRGGTLTTESVWDDTDIVHVLFNEVIVPNYHHYGGLRLQSSAAESLVVKLQTLNANDPAGLTAAGRPMAVDDRIGGVVQVIGAPGHPVVMTALSDDSVGAGFTLRERPQFDTNGNGIQTGAAQPGAWRSIRLDRYSHDRNLAVINEVEDAFDAGGDANSSPHHPEELGEMAPFDKAGDDNRRLGFEVHGDIRYDDPSDVDVYSFDAPAGTEIWIDLDRTTHAADLIVELINVDGDVLARSDNSPEERVDETLIDGGARSMDRDPFLRYDFYTTNPRDPGMRLVLPGPVGETLTYFVRVRSSLAVGNLGTGDSLRAGEFFTVGDDFGSAEFEIYKGFALEAPATGGLAMNDGETFQIDDGTSVSTFEFDMGFAVDVNGGYAAIADGETLTIDDGVNPAVVFQFHQPTGAPVVAPNIAVNLNTSNTPLDIATILAAAIARTNLQVTAHQDGTRIHLIGAQSVTSSDADVAVVGDAPGTLTAAGGPIGVPIRADMTADQLATAVNNAIAGSGLNVQPYQDQHAHVFLIGAAAVPLEASGLALLGQAPTSTLSADRFPVLLLDSMTADEVADAVADAINQVPSSYPLSVSARVRNGNVVIDGVHASFNPEGTSLALLANTSGHYQMQIRLREFQEVPGSTVKYADIRYATNGVELFGFPGHSPLLGETAEDSTYNNAQSSAQDIGNLLATDRNTISLAGYLSGRTDVDWYRMTIDMQGIQSIPGINDMGSIWATIFDIDYADGMARPDLSMWVFDANRKLILVGQNSNVAEDRPDPIAGASVEDLSRGSAGSGDPFIGTAYLHEKQTYYIAVTSTLATSQEIGNNSPLTRREPLNSVDRIVTEHLRPVGNPNGGAYGHTNYGDPQFLGQRLNVIPNEFHLSDVIMYVNTAAGSNTDLYTVNPFTGAYQTDVTRTGNNHLPGVSGTYHYNDIAMRNDGRLYSLSAGGSGGGLYNGAQQPTLRRFDTGDARNAVSTTSTGITFYEINSSSLTALRVHAAGGIDFEAMVHDYDNDRRNIYAVGIAHSAPYGTNAPVGPPTGHEWKNLMYVLDSNGVAYTHYSIANSSAFATGSRSISGEKIPLGRLFSAPTIITGAVTLATPAFTPTYSAGAPYADMDIADGEGFTLDGNRFEFDSGFDIILDPQGPGIIRDGNTFELDSQTFEIDSGPVLVTSAAGSLAALDGTRVTVTGRDSGGGSVTRAFEFDTAGNGTAGGTVLPNPTGTSANAIAAALAQGIGQYAGFLVTATASGDRVTLENDSAPTPVSSGLIALEGAYGTTTAGARAVSFEETHTGTQFGNDVDAAVTAWRPAATVGYGERFGTVVELDGHGDRLSIRGVSSIDVSGTAAFRPVSGSGPGVSSGRPVFIHAGMAANEVALAIEAAVNGSGLGYSAATSGGSGSVEIQPPGVGTTPVVGFDDPSNPLQFQGQGVGGDITGLAYLPTSNPFVDQMYAVDDNGGFYRVHREHGNPATSPGAWSFHPVDPKSGYRYVTYRASQGPYLEFIGQISYDGAAIEFSGLTAGPRNVENGEYANLVFATSRQGFLYALDTDGNLEPVFQNSSDRVRLRSNGSGSTLSSVEGVTFSNIDYNLWHMTRNRWNDVGHGVTQTHDSTRNGELGYRARGYYSMYFGLEDQRADDVVNYEFAYDGGRALVRNQTVPERVQPIGDDYWLNTTAGSSEAFYSYNMPGGAHGSMTTSTFSLEGYSAQDEPTLYFTYYAETEDDPFDSNSDLDYDGARAYISDDGADWDLIATNTDIDDGGRRLDRFGVEQIMQTPTVPTRIVDEIVDSRRGTTGSWRQARVDLSRYAGQDDLRLRFSFSTASDLEIGNNYTRQPDTLRHHYLASVPGIELIDGNEANGHFFEVDGQRFEFDLGYSFVLPNVAGLTIADGEWFEVDDGLGTVVRFEFDKDGSVIETSTLRAIAISDGDSTETVAAATFNAIALVSTGTLDVTPYRDAANDPTRIYLTRAMNLTQGTTLPGDTPDVVLQGSAPGVVSSGIRVPVLPSMTKEEVAQVISQVVNQQLVRLADLNDGALVPVPITAPDRIEALDGSAVFGRTFTIRGMTTRGDVRTVSFGFNVGSADVTIPISFGDTPDAVAAAMFSAINAARVSHELDVTASASQSTVTITGPVTFFDPGNTRMVLLNYDEPIIQWDRLVGDLMHVTGYEVTEWAPLGYSGESTSLGDLQGDSPWHTSTEKDFGTGNRFDNRYNLFERGQDNRHEGFYIDDIIIGFAERGEMVTDANQNGGNLTGFDFAPEPVLIYPEPPIVMTGDYQLEVRRGTDYGEYGGDFPYTVISHTFDTNDRLAEGWTMTIPAAEDIVHGRSFTIDDGLYVQRFVFFDETIGGGGGIDGVPIYFQAGDTPGNTNPFTAAKMAGLVAQAVNDATALAVTAGANGSSDRVDLFGAVAVSGLPATFYPYAGGDSTLDGGDKNLFREKGQVVIENNSIMHSGGYGILVAPDRETGLSSQLPHPGSGRTLDVPNDLVPGIMIENNLVAYSSSGGIRFRGDSSGSSVPTSGIPFGRIVNNTFYGPNGSAGGTGILVQDNASPTLLNNIVANFNVGISVDASSRLSGFVGTVIGGTVYQKNVRNTNSGTGLGSFARTIGASDPLFVDEANGNFYLDHGEDLNNNGVLDPGEDQDGDGLLDSNEAVDSSVDSLEERQGYFNEVLDPVGIPVSPIVSPVFDLYGQLRKDDPSVAPDPGGGLSIFKDRGAIDRVDFVGPTAALKLPLDNDPGGNDRDSNLHDVFLAGSKLTEFAIQLTDQGVNIDDASVVASTLKLFKNGIELVEGLDYFFTYNSTNNLIRLFPAPGIWLTGNEYTIVLDNDAIRDLANNPLQPNRATPHAIYEDCYFVITLAGIDFGDAPDQGGVFPTLLGSDGARHVIVPEYYLGASVNPEPDARQNSDATGDGYDDGVQFQSALLVGQQVDVVVTAFDGNADPNDLTAVIGYLDAWIDYDADLAWDDSAGSAERVFSAEPLTLGDNALTIAVPATAVQGAAFARFRFSSVSTGLAPTGEAQDGEVEDFMLRIANDPEDFGDAPNAYHTTFLADGPRHVVTDDVAAGNRLFVGSGIDAEMDGQPSALANADDLNGSMPDDEDGIVFLDPLVPGQTVDMEVLVTSLAANVAAGARLNMWIDINGDGDFDDVDPFATWSEHVLVDQLVQDQSITAGANVVSFAMPPQGAAVEGDTIARVRLSADTELGLASDGVLPGGVVPLGEVQDMQVRIIRSPDDFGDAPDDPTDASDYPTLLASGGARHRVRRGFHLGTNPTDYEFDSAMVFPDSTATADDISDPANDDEDGVVIVGAGSDGMLRSGMDNLVEVTLTNTVVGKDAYLNLWIDFNGDGDWDDTGVDDMSVPWDEHVVADLQLSSGVNQIYIRPPSDINSLRSFMRARLSDTAGLSYDGPVQGVLAPDGEVEDYAVSLVAGDASISGYKFNDLNANGVWDTTVTLENPQMVFSGKGTSVVAETDDASSVAQPLGFAFSFFGQNYTQMYVNNNGNVTFGAPTAATPGIGFPQNAPMIAPFWADVDTRNYGGSVDVLRGTNPTTLNPFVRVDWNNVGYNNRTSGTNSDARNTFSLYLEDDTGGDIVVFGYDLNNDGAHDLSWTTGDKDGGSNGFGTQPAIIGFDAGDSTNFQILAQPSSLADLDALQTQYAFRFDPGDGLPVGPERGLPGVVVYLDTNDDGRLNFVDYDGDAKIDFNDSREQPTEPWTITAFDDPNTANQDETGEFSFSNLFAGNHVVRELVGNDWTTQVDLNSWLGTKWEDWVQTSPSEITYLATGDMEFQAVDSTDPSLADEQTFTLNDGTISVLFEFNNDGFIANTSTSTQNVQEVAYTIGAPPDADVMATAIADAINTAGTTFGLEISAVAGVDPVDPDVVTLTGTGASQTVIFDEGDTPLTVTASRSRLNGSYLVSLLGGEQFDLAHFGNFEMPRVRVVDVAIAEGHFGQTQVDVTLEITQSFGSPLTIQYETSDGTAEDARPEAGEIEDDDYDYAQGSVQVDPQGTPLGVWNTTVVTANTQNDYDHSLSGDTLAWEARDANDWEIYLYDHSDRQTIQLTDNDTDDRFPSLYAVGDTKYVVWSGVDPAPGESDLEIFLYNSDTGTILQVTDNSYDDLSPVVTPAHIAWLGETPTDDDIFLFDHRNAASQLPVNISNNSFDDNEPRIAYDPVTDNSNIAWKGYDGFDDEVYLYRTEFAVLNQLSNNMLDDRNVEIDARNVVWVGYDGSDNEVFLYQLGAGASGARVQLTDNTSDDFSVDVSGDNVVWQGTETGDLEIYHADVSNISAAPRIQNLSNNPFFADERPQIFGNQVVWHTLEGDWEVYHHELGTSRKPVNLSNNGYRDWYPQLSGEIVAWKVRDGQDYEIVIATREEPLVTVTIPLWINGDLEPELDEFFYLNLLGAIAGSNNQDITNYIDASQAIIQILNDDSTGVLVTPTTGLVTTEAGGTATFTIQLDRQPTDDVTIGLSSSDTSEGTVGPAAVTFTSTNWNTPQTVTVTGVDDFLDDGDVAYSILTGTVLSNDNTFNGVDPADVGVTNTDDDTPGVTVTPTTGLVTTEKSAADTFTIVLDSQPSANVTIGLTSSNTAEGTVTPASVMFTASNWNVPQTVTVVGVDDVLVDGDVAYAIITAAATSTDVNYNGVDSADVGVTNIDDDSTGITVSPTAGLVTTEAGGTDSFTIVLDRLPTANVTIGLTSSDMTEGTLSVSSLIFTPANWSVPQTVTVTGADDFVDDGDVAYTIVTAAASSTDSRYSGYNVADVTVTNTDDDTAGITVTPTTGLVTTESGGQATFTLELDSEPTANVTIGLSSSDTTEGTVLPASVTFTASNWDSPRTVTVTGIEDSLADGDVAYTILTAAATSIDGNYLALDPDDVALTNTDDDTAGITVTPTAGLVTTESGGTATFTIELDSEPTAAVTIGLTSGDTTEGTVSPSSVTFTASDWNSPQTVTVTGLSDFLVDGDVLYAIITAPATSIDGNYSGLNPADVTVTNTDDDNRTRFDVAIVSEPTAFEQTATGEVGTLPTGSIWVDEWTSFYAEIWVGTPGYQNVGISGGSLDFTYDTNLFSAVAIEYGPGFDLPLAQSGTIDDAGGTVWNLGAGTLSPSVGDDAHALLARIRFEPTAADAGVPHNANGAYITPAQWPFGVDSPTISLFGVGSTQPEVDTGLEIDVWPVGYDINDSGRVDFGDLAYFAAAFQQDVSDPSATFAYASDFDHSGTVDFGDLAFLAASFQRELGDGLGSLQYPPNFPIAWQTAPLTLDASTVGQHAGEVLTDTQLASVAQAAIARVASGGDEQAAATLDDVRFEIVDLPGDLLGRAVGQSTIQVDINAADHGWFVDTTPWNDQEFVRHTTEFSFSASPNTAASARVDLLTTVMHELGHILGAGHSSDQGLMAAALPLGTRRLPDHRFELLNDDDYRTVDFEDVDFTLNNPTDAKTTDATFDFLLENEDW